MLTDLLTGKQKTDRQTERRTDMTKLTVTFRNYVKAPKMLNDGCAKL